ncbi:hypothetical protein LHFGNBLO_001371 [Mesorhizobium sp. AR10]|uniref:hypothetical protein n=1 Tax=Mesorhizobium sp. AR10 TaxID=2865839 RepID=UPI00215F43A9|nr:hypothetical protein [Mesorhizobium sp. AR10]UVK39956.1 hypothetical protein LHFGNBLO_001371 [Mesorhizobium sp. AR10]
MEIALLFQIVTQQNARSISKALVLVEGKALETGWLLVKRLRVVSCVDALQLILCRA